MKIYKMIGSLFLFLEVALTNTMATILEILFGLNMLRMVQKIMNGTGVMV